MNNLYSQNSEISIEKLIESNLDIVKKIAWQIHGRVHNVIEIEDLIQQGMEGLVHAAQKYSPRENVTFPQYAQLRIRGSIIDYLRKNSNLCRTTIKKNKTLKKLRNSLNKVLVGPHYRRKLFNHLVFHLMNMIIGKNPLRRTQYKVLIVLMMSIHFYLQQSRKILNNSWNQKN